MDYGQKTGVCPWCGAQLELSKSNFNKGKFKRCAPCYGKQHLREWYRKNRERELGKAKAYYQRTADQRRKISRAVYWGLSPAERKRRNRSMALKGKYGLTLEQYERMFQEQNGLCFLCGNPPAKDRPLSVDHCHKEKRVRKLLCEVCNRSLGIIERDPTWVDRAVQYLKS